MKQIVTVTEVEGEGLEAFTRAAGDAVRAELYLCRKTCGYQHYLRETGAGEDRLRDRQFYREGLQKRSSTSRRSVVYANRSY